MVRALHHCGGLAYGAFLRLRKCAYAAAMFCAVPAMADDVVIAALGDSLTQGYGLPAEQGLVPQLQTWLEANGAEVQMINAGVSGDTTAGGLSRIAWTLTPDVDALIVALGGNDVLRGLPPEQARSNLDGILQYATDQGLPVLLIGVTAPGNYGPEYKAAFDAIYPDLAERYGADLIPDLLAPLSDDGSLSAAQVYMQSDGVHPNAEGVALIVEAFGPHVEDLARRAAQADPAG